MFFKSIACGAAPDDRQRSEGCPHGRPGPPEPFPDDPSRLGERDGRQRPSRRNQPDHPLDRLPAALRVAAAARALRLPDSAQPDLLVEFRLARRDHAGRHDRDRHLPCDELYAECEARLRFGRTHHARRQLGWLIRYLHMVGASMFFAIVYIHLFRGLYYGSYKNPRELLWIIGVIILLLMIATAFMGYV